VDFPGHCRAMGSHKPRLWGRIGIGNSSFSGVQGEVQPSEVYQRNTQSEPDACLTTIVAESFSRQQLPSFQLLREKRYIIEILVPVYILTSNRGLRACRHPLALTFPLKSPRLEPLIYRKSVLLTIHRRDGRPTHLAPSQPRQITHLPLQGKRLFQSTH
jgi:hypothetical protein